MANAEGPQAWSISSQMCLEHDVFAAIAPERWPKMSLAIRTSRLKQRIALRPFADPNSPLGIHGLPPSHYAFHLELGHNADVGDCRRG